MNQGTINTITLTDSDGVEKAAEALLYFKVKKNNKKYIVYSFGEKDSKGLDVIHTSAVTKENGKIYLDKIEDQTEWEEVRAILRKIVE